MLNCSVLDCILHPHHVHRHQLQILHQLSMLHHRDEDPDHVAMPSPVATSEGSTRSSGGQGEVDDVIDTILNETDDELSELSHVDAPNDSGYMIGGVLIAMLLVALIIVLLAVTISKLRKREEASAASRDVVAMQTLPPPPTAISVQGAPTTMLWQYPVFGADSCQEPISFPLPAVQPDSSAVTTTPSHPSSLGRVRINLRGQWKKWIKRKPSTEIYTIPAELRPQLKHMYVY